MAKLNTHVMVTVLFLVIVSASSCYITNTTSRWTSQYSVASDVSLMIDFGNGTVLNYEGLVGTDVLNVTKSVVTVNITWYGDLAFVNAIAGVYNNVEGGLWWQYWVNEVYGTVASNKYVIHDKDAVTWRLTTSAFVQNHDREMDWTSVTILIGMILVGIGTATTLYFIMVRRE